MTYQHVNNNESTYQQIVSQYSYTFFGKNKKQTDIQEGR